MSRIPRRRPVDPSSDTVVADEDDTVAAEALRRSGLGDETAFSQLYDETSALVHGIVIKVVRNRALAEEVTQEVFLELWRLAPRYDATKGSVRSWVATVAHRRAVDRVRAEESARARDDTEARHRPVPHDSVVEEVTDRLERTRVARALDRLSGTQREAVTLAYYGGHTYRQVATLLDLPEGTVKTRIRDGLIKLRDHLGVTT